MTGKLGVESLLHKLPLPKNCESYPTSRTEREKWGTRLQGLYQTYLSKSWRARH